MKHIITGFTKSSLYLFVIVLGITIAMIPSCAQKTSTTTPSCAVKNSYTISQDPNAQEGDVWVNIFVHGIMSIRPHVSWSNIIKFFKDDIEKTLYEDTVLQMREDPFFYKNQAMQQIGFHKIDPSIHEGNSSATLAYVHNELRDFYNIKSNNLYYTFGWSGLLSPKSRYRESKRFFIALEHEIKRLNRLGVKPKIRVIAYSHGGNVSLNLGAIRQKEFPASTLSIDELIMFGSPIISDTDYLVNDKIFKSVINVYSFGDRIQILDLFAPNQMFSERVFRPRKDFELPEKLTQVQFKVTRCTQKTRKNPKLFQLSHDTTNPKIVYGKKGLLRDSSPGHIELWFFGWTPIHYRDHLPIHPLPAVAFAPILSHYVKKCNQRNKTL